ncbi:hypothetical protein PUR28_08450 [Streptomyces sp. BE308]|uniref:WYL domain-containing protein n=1 Tax=Streptomyces sp. BE308 TaxID=3002529 RepID=UPI002E75E4DD|nr:hypothetical protein [Streptomyces sp. BE308]MEE1790805.1 hypothetical protein [Streptomyces sp. BE308]
MPAEVTLALRGTGRHAPFEPVPPVVRTLPVTSAEVDREAAATATAFAAHAASVLATCSAAPPVLLKSGGVGTRELSRIGRAAQCEGIVVRLHLPQDTAPFATVIREAELLGVVARGCLSPIGAALRADDSEAAETLAAVCERLLPEATRTVRFGADLTAVVTGTPSARLAALLDTVADKEAGGTASVWRFSPTTVRRALDTVPTVTPVTVDLSALAARLRAAPTELPAPDPFGTGVPYGTDTEEIVAGYAKNLAYADVRQVAHAVNAGTAITVEYVAASGNRTVRTLSELVLDPPHVYAWCHLRDDERVFTLSRIHGVIPG